MKVYIAEVTICDHPEYETFEGVYRTAEEAIKRATAALEEELEDCGEEDEVVKVTDNSNDRRESYHVSFDDGLSDWFIHSEEI